jgi:hypothetical protein
MNTAHQLSPLQTRGLRKVGDVLIPGDTDLPSFSKSGCIAHVDRMLEYMYAADRDGVKALLGVCGALPKVAVRGLLTLTEHHAGLPNAIGSVLRLINTGLKGVVMTLYYSDVGEGTSIYKVIQYDAKVVTRPAATNGG